MVHGYKRVQYIGFSRLYKPFYTRFLLAYLRHFLQSDYPRYRRKIQITVTATTQSGHGITGTKSVKINLQDLNVSGSGILFNARARLGSHELCHSLIHFYGKGAEQHRKLHAYDYPGGSKIRQRHKIEGRLTFRGKWRADARMQYYTVRVIDYEKLLNAP